MSTDKAPRSAAAATDVSEFVTDLDGGQFDIALSVALSKVASTVVDHEKKGKVSIELSFERIAGTHQVRVAHTLKYLHPTSTGKASEETGGATVLHVGKYGALSLSQPRLFGEQSALDGLNHPATK